MRHRCDNQKSHNDQKSSISDIAADKNYIHFTSNKTTRMKQLLTILALLIVGSSVASAQTSEESYFFLTYIFPNTDARFDVGLPQAFPDQDQNSFNNTQWRGFGQAISMKTIFPWFDEVYNENSNIHFDGSQGTTDQDYIEQFQNARGFTVDSILTWMYSLDGNAFNNSETLGSIFQIIRSSYDFSSPSYITSGGFNQAYSDLKGEGDVNVLAEEYYDAPTLAGNIPSGTTVTPTIIGYEPGTHAFGRNESAILMFMTPQDPAYTGAEINDRINTQGLDDQRNYIFGQTEFATGDFGTDANGELFDTRSDSLTFYKVLGLVLYRQGNGIDRVGDESTDTVYSSWQRLTFLQRRSLMDMRARVFGTVELADGGVQYQYGHDAADQGLGVLTPNPARVDARLPFALNENAEVTIEIYAINGELVETLIQGLKYIPGNYSVPVPVSEMENGAYVIRMSANDKAYSMKFTVAK